MTPSVTPHILVVDDDPAIRGLVTDYLMENDLRVSSAADGRQMTQVLQDGVVDLILLDLRLPDADGMTLARQLRDNSKVPIIILTGRRDPADRVMGLELAADDYLTKPFDNRELLARIRAVLRRTKEAPPEARLADKVRAYRFAGWELNLRIRRLVSPRGAVVELSNGELNLLVAFLSAPQRVLTRDQLLGLSRLHGAEIYDRSIDVQILRLRRKIEPDPSRPEYIKTERHAGYIFDLPVDVVSA
jgi:two-component system OmpR family response regulator